MIQEGLGDRRKVADRSLLRVTVPSAQNRERLQMLIEQVRDPHTSANARYIRARIRKIRAARANQLVLQFTLSPHENLLHLFGRLILMVLAQVTVAARDRNLLRVCRNLSLDKLSVFVLSPFETLP